MVGKLIRKPLPAASFTAANLLASLLTAQGQIIRRGASAPEAYAAETANTFLGGNGTTVESRTAAQVRASLDIEIGTWTPTLTGTANIDATTASLGRYLRVADCVIVFGTFEADTTAGGGASTTMTMSLPIASNFTSGPMVGGVFAQGTITAVGGINADTSTNRLLFNWGAQSANNRQYRFIAGYIIA